MKIKAGFDLCDVCDEKVVVAYGEQNIDFSKVISLNESAAFLWNAVGKEEFTVEQMADILCAEYEVTPETALNDVREMLAQWQEQDLVE